MSIDPRADRAAIKAAMQRASLFLVTSEAKMDQHKAFHRHLVGHHFMAAAEQALLAGDVDLAHVAHELFMLVHYDEARSAKPNASPAPEEPNPAPRRKLPQAAQGKRERAKLAKAGAVTLGAA